MIAYRPGAAPARLYPSTTATFDGDLDLIAVELAMNGEDVRLTRAEKIEAARLLDARGLTVTDIADRIHSGATIIANWKANGWKSGKPARKAKPKLDPPVCGETRMYRQHLARGETPCPACKAANSAEDRRYRLTGSRKAAA